MSWSVSAIGKSDKVKEALAKQFENAKIGTSNIPAEQQTVMHIENAVNAMLDHATANGPLAVKVTASGSASTKTATWIGSISTTLQFESIYGFVE